MVKDAALTDWDRDHLWLLSKNLSWAYLKSLNTEKFYFYFSNDYKDIYGTFKLKTLKLLDKLTILSDEFHQLERIKRLSVSNFKTNLWKLKLFFK